LAIARAAASGRAVSADGRAAASPAAAPQAPAANIPATGAALTMRCPSKRHQGGPGSAGTLPRTLNRHPDQRNPSHEQANGLAQR
jgi:hypothetical protein